MTERPVVVVPTRNAAEGFAALLALDPSLDAAANAGPMTEAGRAIQTLVVTEAVRDATIGGRKVKRGQTIALDPGRRPRRRRAATATRRSSPAVAALDARLRAPHAVLRRRRRPRRGGGDGPPDRGGRARRRGRGPPRRPAVLPVPDRGRVGVAKATSPVAAGPDRPGRAAVDPAGAVRAGGRRRRCGGPGSSSTSTRSATCSSTCRGATTTCARCASSATWSGWRTATVVSAQATRRRRPGRARLPRPDAADDRPARGRHGQHRCDLVRAPVHRAPAARRRRGRRVRARSSTSAGG